MKAIGNDDKDSQKEDPSFKWREIMVVHSKARDDSFHDFLVYKGYHSQLLPLPFVLFSHFYSKFLLYREDPYLHYAS